MGVYLIVITLLIFFGFVDLENLKQKRKVIFLVIIFILLVLLDGLRWETGIDWDPYRYFFEKIPEYRSISWEPAYVLLNDIFYSVSQNYSLFLIVNAIIIYALFLKSIYDYTKYPLITALCFHCAFLGYMGMNRQLIAVAICLFTFRYIVSREILKFSFYVIIASLFHMSALYFFIAYFLNRQIPRYIYVSSLITAFILNPIVSALIDRMLSVTPFQIQYLISAKLGLGMFAFTEEEQLLNPMLHNDTINIFFGLTKRIIIFLPLYLNITKLKKKVPNIELMLNIYFMSILFYIIFNNSIQILVSKGNLYFGGLFEIFLLPCLIYLFNKNNAVLVYFFIILLMIMTVSKVLYFTPWYFVPYKGIYINTDYFRDVLRIPLS